MTDHNASFERNKKYTSRPLSGERRISFHPLVAAGRLGNLAVGGIGNNENVNRPHRQSWRERSPPAKSAADELLTHPPTYLQHSGVVRQESRVV